MTDKLENAKIRLPDGREAYDCMKLASIQTEGIFVKDYGNHLIVVQTQNTRYEFVSRNGQITGRAYKEDGSQPWFLAIEVPVRIHGSTWGGSMLKVGYIGVDMHLEFSYEGQPCVTTSRIASVQVAELEMRRAA